MNIRNLYFPVLIFPVLACVLISCQKQDSRSAGTVPAKKQIKTSNGPYQASNTIYWDLIHTKLEVAFDFQKQQLNGKAFITLKPQFYAQNTLVLDAKGFDIHSIAFENGTTISAYTYSANKISISFNTLYTYRDTLQLIIDYTAKPNELPKGGSDAITEDKGLYFIDPLEQDPLKPTEIWTQGETQSSSCWFPTIDSPNQRLTQEMYITAPSKFQVISNGELIYKTTAASNTTWYWKMDLPHAPYLFMMAVGEFAKVTDSWKGKEVSYYVEPAYEKYAQHIFGETPAMIEFYSKKLNYPYPWPKYSQIVVRDFVSGAMENTSASIFMEDLQVDDRYLADDDWESIIAHELFHHWFGDLVTCESWSNLPLNESFANFSEIAWIEHKHGFDEGLLHAQEDLSGYLKEAETMQNPLIRFRYTDREDMFDRHSYNKGGLVLNLLRNAVGEDAFYASLHLYLTRNAYSSVEIDELRIAFEDVTGEDMHWFFDAWFMKPGHAELNINHYANKENKVEISIEQKQDTIRGTLYRLPLQLDYKVKGDTAMHSQRIWISKQKQTYAIPVEFSKLDYIVVDSKHVVVGTVIHEKSRELMASQLIYGTDYLIRSQALDFLVKPTYPYNSKTENTIMDFFLAASAIYGKTTYDRTRALHALAKENPNAETGNAIHLLFGLNDSFHAVRETALLEFAKHPIPNVELIFLPKLKEMALTEPDGEIRSNAIYLIASIDNAKFIDVYKAGIDAPSYHVAGACLNSLLIAKDPETIKRLPEFESITNTNIVTSLAVYYIQVQDQTHYDWFEKNMTNTSDQNVYNLMGAFTKYTLLQSTADKERGIAFLKKISVENKHDIIRQNAKTYYEYIEKSIKQ